MSSDNCWYAQVRWLALVPPVARLTHPPSAVIVQPGVMVRLSTQGMVKGCLIPYSIYTAPAPAPTSWAKKNQGFNTPLQLSGNSHIHAHASLCSNLMRHSSRLL